MRNVLLVVFCLTAALGCGFLNNLGNDNGANTGNGAGANASSNAKPSPSATVAESKASPPKASIIPLLRKSAGKYPNDIKLLNNPELKERLAKLLAKDFGPMKAHWNVETPMEIENGIFKASACEAHNCGSNTYVIFIDLQKDNINVFHVEDSGTKHYFENGEIRLPAKFTEDLKS